MQGAAPNAITTQPLSRLSIYMRWANRGNAALLIVTGVLGIFGAISGGAGDVLSSALLSLYVGGFGALLLRYEFDVGMELRRDYGFMYTFLGRAAYLLLVANLAWTCEPLGLPTAILTNANAAFSGYLMFVHPSFTSGAVSATTMDGGDGSGDELRDVTRDSSSFDPSSAVRM